MTLEDIEKMLEEQDSVKQKIISFTESLGEDFIAACDKVYDKHAETAEKVVYSHKSIDVDYGVTLQQLIDKGVPLDAKIGVRNGENSSDSGVEVWWKIPSPTILPENLAWVVDRKAFLHDALEYMPLTEAQKESVLSHTWKHVELIKSYVSKHNVTAGSILRYHILNQ
jgi:hypothetical protein